MNSRKPSHDSLRLFRLFRTGSAPGDSVCFPMRWSPSAPGPSLLLEPHRSPLKSYTAVDNRKTPRSDHVNDTCRTPRLFYKLVHSVDTYRYIIVGLSVTIKKSSVRRTSMKTHHITETRISAFEKALRREEKSPATVDKYLRDVRAFSAWLSGETVTKERASA